MSNSTPRLRRSLLVLALLAPLACGGDSTAPEEPYPDVSGRFVVTGDFDGLSEVGDWSGSLQLTRPDGRGEYTGRLTVALVEGGLLLDEELTGSVERDGALRFQIADASGSWEFTGTADGGALRGRHVLSGGGDVLRGDWLAMRH
jgi:hypothetical protein